MRIEQTFSTSFTALKLNKVRSFLTMLGVIIGVFSVIILVSIVKGVENYITNEFSSLGSNLIFIMPGKVNFQDDPTKSFTGNKLEYKHVEMIKTQLGDSTVGITPYLEIYQKANYQNKEYNAALTGTDSNNLEVFDLVLKEGRFYTKSEAAGEKKVAVLGYDVAQELFGDRQAVGKQIKMSNTNFEIIGVLEEKSPNYDNLLFIPDTTFKQVFNIKVISTIAVKTKPNINPEDFKREVTLVLRQDMDKNDFTVMTQKDMLETIQSILKILSTVLTVISGISLLVGGIGIMNIMLVAVTERTQEIGLRKALGATSLLIAGQFSFEAIMLSLLGGIIGLILGIIATFIANTWIQAEIPLWSVGLAMGFSLIVGLVFGTYPAIKASRKDPIEALRYE